MPGWGLEKLEINYLYCPVSSQELRQIVQLGGGFQCHEVVLVVEVSLRRPAEHGLRLLEPAPQGVEDSLIRPAQLCDLALKKEGFVWDIVLKS